MIDRTGMAFEELLAIQEQQLDNWFRRMDVKIFLPVRDYVLAMNQEATDATQKHRVYRGQDLIELLRTWPERNTDVYPNLPSEAQDMI